MIVDIRSKEISGFARVATHVYVALTGVQATGPLVGEEIYKIVFSEFNSAED